MAFENGGASSSTLCSTSRRSRVPESGAVSIVTDAASTPGSSPRFASQWPQSATHTSICSWSTSAAPSGSVPITTL